MKSRRAVNNDRLTYAYYLLFSLAAFTFTLSTLLTLPVFD
jgi:hypothetical protein